MEQRGNEIISGVRCLWRGCQGICSNIWEVIWYESPTCVLQQLCFSHTGIKHHHGEWRWEGLHAWVAGAGHREFPNGILKGYCVTPLFISLTEASLDWIRHNHNKRRNNNLWVSETAKLVSYRGVLSWPVHSSWYPLSCTRQLLLYFSTAHFPLIPHHYLQSPHTSLKPVSSTADFPPCTLWALWTLSQAQNLLEDHCEAAWYVFSCLSPGGRPVLANLVGKLFILCSHHHQ